VIQAIISIQLREWAWENELTYCVSSGRTVDHRPSDPQLVAHLALSNRGIGDMLLRDGSSHGAISTYSAW
jgi:hypothetical protein